MPKKIGIITIYDETNYGNRLQNLAVQTCLKNRGYAVKNIVWRYSRFRWLAKPFWLRFRYWIQRDKISGRSLTFRRFIHRYTPTRYFFNKDRSVPAEICEDYDYFVTGSDQVWNLDMLRGSLELGIYFLTFADDRKRVCISPSIGVATVGDEDAAWMRQALKGYRYLSCREKQGALELSRITGEACEWLIDPTLFVTREEWQKLLSINSHKRTRPYVFVFFLDGMSEELNLFIRRYAADHYEIINPSDQASSWFCIDPSEFVSLLSGAHMVFTDSFHVSAFSINLHVPFYVFNRKKWKTLNSRIESLCEVFQMSSRYIPEQKAFTIQEHCDFEEADRQLMTERKRFSAYLDKCFEA